MTQTAQSIYTLNCMLAEFIRAQGEIGWSENLNLWKDLTVFIYLFIYLF